MARLNLGLLHAFVLVSVEVLGTVKMGRSTNWSWECLLVYYLLVANLLYRFTRVYRELGEANYRWVLSWCLALLSLAINVDVYGWIRYDSKKYILQVDEGDNWLCSVSYTLFLQLKPTTANNRLEIPVWALSYLFCPPINTQCPLIQRAAVQQVLSYLRSVSCLCMFIQLLGPRASLEHPALGCDWFNWKSCGTTGHRPIIYLEFIRHNIMIYYDIISNLAVVCISIPVMVGWPCRPAGSKKVHLAVSRWSSQVPRKRCTSWRTALMAAWRRLPRPLHRPWGQGQSLLGHAEKATLAAKWDEMSTGQNPWMEILWDYTLW